MFVAREIKKKLRPIFVRYILATLLYLNHMYALKRDMITGISAFVILLNRSGPYLSIMCLVLGVIWEKNINYVNQIIIYPASAV